EFRNGDKASELTIIGAAGKRETGTSVRFIPDAKYFDSPNISVPKLKHVLKAKAVLCPGLHVTLKNIAANETDQWHYEDGRRDYLLETTRGEVLLPLEPFVGAFAAATEAGDWAVGWVPGGGEGIGGR